MINTCSSLLYHIFSVVKKHYFHGVKILFLFPYPLQQAPSQRFRFEQYFEALLKNGYSINSQSFWGEYYWKVLYKKGNAFQKLAGLLNGFWRRLIILGSVPAADIVFIHRELTPVGPPVFEWIITRLFRKKVIFDFDDAIWLPNTSESNKAAAFLKWHGKTASICQWAWRVSAGNEFLAAYARQFNPQVVVNPTTVDADNYHRHSLRSEKALNNPPIIGWTGSHSTLPYLDQLWPMLEDLATMHAFQFMVIANQPPQAAYPWLKFIQWNQATEIEDLAQFDIGVMPLKDDDWSKGKCGFKALQYMAMGIATVASPVGVNNDIVQHGANGFLCNDSQSWLSTLQQLLEDETLRKKVGDAGLNTVSGKFSVASNSENFLTLFLE